MLPYSNKPPQAVVDLVKEFHADEKHLELVIHENMFLLFHKEEIPPAEEGQPTTVHVGELIKRAYWRDATGMTNEQVKAILGIR